MKNTRRRFLQNIPITALALSAPASAMPGGAPKPLKPPALQPGGTIGLVCPGSPVPPGRLETARRDLNQRGYTCKPGESLTEPYLCDLAGPDDRRLADLNAMIRDPKVNAIFALRGGYGTNRLLGGIDYESLRQRPKWIVGYSDITSLLLAAYNRAGVIGLHADAFPLASDGNSIQPVADAMWDLLEGRAAPGGIPQIRKFSWTGPARPETWAPGRARGVLLGGNLSRLASLAGTPFAVPADRDVILFLEEVDEEAYRVDRFLTQLIESGVFDRVRGAAVGEHKPPGSKPEDAFVIRRSLRDRLMNLEIPILANLPFGHRRMNLPLALGAEVELDADLQTLSYNEAVTS